MPGEWHNFEIASDVSHGTFDLVITNPPFGGNAEVDDPHLLDQYELASFGARETRAAMPAEQLFVEAAWKFLKPGGVLAIVLPDSILNNPNLAFIREWILTRSRVVASIDLPKTTFAEGGGVPNPSVLIVQRLSIDQIKLAESRVLPPNDVFMAIPKTTGRDLRGNPVYSKTPHGEVLLNTQMEPELDDELGFVIAEFTTWIKEGRI